MDQLCINRGKNLGTVCFADLDKGSVMIIFESILITFVVSVILDGP